MLGAYRKPMEDVDSTSFNGIPLNGSAKTTLDEFRMTSRNSQVGFLFQGDAGKAKLTGFWQMDFNLLELNSAYTTSNQFAPRIRHAMGMVDLPSGWNFMAGQFWNLGMVNGKLIVPLTERSPVSMDNGTFAGFPDTRRSRRSASPRTS